MTKVGSFCLISGGLEVDSLHRDEVLGDVRNREAAERQITLQGKQEMCIHQGPLGSK